MVSLFEQYAINELITDFKEQVITAFKTKKVKRLSSRFVGGQQVYTEFEAVVNATGRLVKSVRDVKTDDGVQVLCAAYVDKLIFGQELEAVNEFEIFNWMKAKGISNDESVSKLISNKIYKEGSSIYLYWKGQDSGLLSDVNIDISLEKLKQVLTKHYANQVASEIVESFKIAA